MNMTESYPTDQIKYEPLISDSEKFETFLAKGIERGDASKRLGEECINLIECLVAHKMNPGDVSGGEVYDELITTTVELTENTAVYVTVLMDKDPTDTESSEQRLRSAVGIMLEFNNWEKPFSTGSGEIDDPATTLAIFVSPTPPIEDFRRVIGESHLAARYEDGSYVDNDMLEYIIASLAAIRSSEESR